LHSITQQIKTLKNLITASTVFFFTQYRYATYQQWALQSMIHPISIQASLPSQCDYFTITFLELLLKSTQYKSFQLFP